MNCVEFALGSETVGCGISVVASLICLATLVDSLLRIIIETCTTVFK